jgi:hypothetical protein
MMVNDDHHKKHADASELPFLSPSCKVSVDLTPGPTTSSLHLFSSVAEVAVLTIQDTPTRSFGSDHTPGGRKERAVQCIQIPACPPRRLS